MLYKYLIIPIKSWTLYGGSFLGYLRALSFGEQEQNFTKNIQMSNNHLFLKT